MRHIFRAALASVALLALAIPIARATTYPGGAEGCTATSSGAKCTYTATRNGGYVASSSGWTVTIVRAGKAVTISDKTHKAQCTNAILAKDKVTVVSTGGQIAAGNPFPAATDGKLPSTGGKPGDYGSCKK